MEEDHLWSNRGLYFGSNIVQHLYICDTFLFLHEVQFTGYLDDNTPFVVRDNIPDVISALEEIGEKLWFSDNKMKSNTNKCHPLSNTQDQNFLKIGNFNIKNSLSEKFLGITFDCKLKFSNYIEDICKKATRKLNFLSRIVPYMNISRRKILMNAFFKSQFNYCPLIWMCYNRSLNHKINRLHERCLRIIYSDKKSSFDELLDKDESVSIHHQNIQKLGIEMFKVLNGENPQIVNEIFHIRDETSYELRQRSCFHIPSVNTVFSGTESIRFLGPKIWELIPNDIKSLENLRDFKTAIKKWKPTSCPCRICKTYLHGVGFL